MSVIDQLKRVRPARSRVTYDSVSGNAIIKKTLPPTLMLFGWPQAMRKRAANMRSEDFRIKCHESDFQNLLTELVAIEVVNESKLYQIICGLEADEMTACCTVFVRLEETPRQVEVDKLEELARLLHLSFILNYQESSDSDYELLEQLYLNHLIKGWFYELENVEPSLQLIHGNGNFSQDGIGLSLNLCTCMWVHYVNANIKEWRKGSLTSSSMQDYLNSWISDYILLDDAVGDVISMMYPLREGMITLKGTDSSSSEYELIMRLRFGAGFRESHLVSYSCLI